MRRNEKDRNPNAAEKEKQGAVRAGRVEKEEWALRLTNFAELGREAAVEAAESLSAHDEACLGDRSRALTRAPVQALQLHPPPHLPPSEAISGGRR